MPPDAQVPGDMTTEALVMAVVVLAQQGHAARGELVRVKRELDAAGLPEATLPGEEPPTASERVRQLAQSRMPLHTMAVDPETEAGQRVLAMMQQALSDGKVEIGAMAKAGLREILTGDSGAVEINLTDHEVVDLVLSGSCFTEVNDGQDDVLVKLVDLTGELGKLKAVWEVSGKLRTADDRAH